MSALRRSRQREREARELDNLLFKFRSLLVTLKQEHSEFRAHLESKFPLASTSPIEKTNSTVKLASSVSPNTSSSSNNNDHRSDARTTSTHTGSSAQKTAKTLWSLKLFPNSGSSRSKTSSPLSISEPYNCQTNYHLMYNNSNSLRMAAGRGSFIVLEGLDRVGKSTLAQNLVDQLKKSAVKVNYLKFPERSTPIGRLIDSYLKNEHEKLDDKAVHMLYSANRWEYDKFIRQSIKNGTTLIVDRYSYSGIAYSCAKNGMDLEWCRNTEVGLPKPDVVIYLQASRREQASRPGFGDERFEKIDFQDKIRKNFEMLIGFDSERWLRFDTDNKTPEEVLNEVIPPVRRFINESATKKLSSIEPLR